MTDAADLVLTNAEVHTLTDPDRVHEAVAIRDGEIVRVGSAYEVEFLVGVETDVIDCEGRVVLPGFVDAHTHLENLGRHLVHADLSGTESAAECVERLSERAAAVDDGPGEWIQGFGYDESEWVDDRYLTREDLDRVSEDRPVVAVRVDMHAASLNSFALERLADDFPPSGVEREGGEPTGVVVEDAAEAVRKAVSPDVEETRELVTAAMEYAVERGVTGVHEMVRYSRAPRVYRDLDAADALPIRVRLNYWADHLESVIETGLATDAGSEFVRTGGIKTFTDGSIGARTARLSEPYEDVPPGSDAGDDGETVDREEDGSGDASDGHARGEWVVEPDELREIVDRADAERYQVTVHAIGDEAVAETLSAFETTADPGASRHRIEHAELATDDHVERMADADVVASMQPNFHRWAQPGGLYDRRLGEDRRERTNRLRDVLDAGVPLAFGSDCMPLDPLLGVHHAVNAPEESQRLSVTEALRAYTLGAAYAGFDEDRVGTVEVGKCADLVVLEESPWEREERIDEIDVATTIVDGAAVYDGTE